MRNTLIYIIFVAAHLFAASAFAAPLPIPKAPSTGAKSFIIQDFESGRVLAEKNADQPVEPASITKLMTAYVVFNELQAGNIALGDMVTISEKAWRTPGSRMFVEVNKQVSVEDLLQGMIVQSGNDATMALAEHIAGSEETFAALMNRHAEEIGMTGSHFINTTGLPDDNHYMTAKDIALLATLLIKKYPEYYHWYSQKKFTFNEITQYNRNKLLWRDESVDGLKTGFTDSAGYCLVTSAKKDGMRLITVVLGTKNANARVDASQALLNYGFRFFETVQLYKAGQELAQGKVWKGEGEQIKLGIRDELFVTIPRGRYDDLDAQVEMRPELIAPIAEGEEVGQISIRLENDEITSRGLVALESVAEAGFFGRAWDGMSMWFGGLFGDDE